MLGTDQVLRSPAGLYWPKHTTQGNYNPTEVLLAVCVAPVVAPRLFRGAYGGLRERAIAGHLPMDRQGQQNPSSHQQNDVTVLAKKTQNWRVSVDNEFLHVPAHTHAGGMRESHPVSKACQRVTSAIDSKCFQRTCAAHPCCITKHEGGLASSCVCVCECVRERGLNCESICADSQCHSIT